MFASASVPQAAPVAVLPASSQDPSQVSTQHLKFPVPLDVQTMPLEDLSEIPRHFVLNCVPSVVQQTPSQVGTQAVML